MSCNAIYRYDVTLSAYAISWYIVIYSLVLYISSYRVTFLKLYFLEQFNILSGTVLFSYKVTQFMVSLCPCRNGECMAITLVENFTLNFHLNVIGIDVKYL